jgi:hypothetical protein
METLMATIILCVPVLILLMLFTGTKVFIFQLHSGIPRFVVGLLCAFSAYLIIWQCSKMMLRRPCVHEATAGFFLLPALLLALLLIPLEAV